MRPVAAIDCGTHSIRLLIASPGPDQGSLTELTRQMVIVRLGEGVDRTRRLSPEALSRTRDALQVYAQRIRDHNVGQVRMVATSASRDADNADEFRDMVVATLGVTPEVISGDEEARLSFTGTVRGLPAHVTEPCMVVDIGGGSTEFIVGTRIDGAVDIMGAISMDLGCVRMTERHHLSDPPTTEQVAALTKEITESVDLALEVVPATRATTLIGLAGSVTTVAGIALGLAQYDRSLINQARVDYETVVRISDELLTLDREGRLRFGVMHPGRVDVIGAGVLILKTVMERAGFHEVMASEYDILDGIAWSMT